MKQQFNRWFRQTVWLWVRRYSIVCTLHVCTCFLSFAPAQSEEKTKNNTAVTTKNTQPFGPESSCVLNKCSDNQDSANDSPLPSWRGRRLTRLSWAELGCFVLLHCCCVLLKRTRIHCCSPVLLLAVGWSEGDQEFVNDEGFAGTGRRGGHFKKK